MVGTLLTALAVAVAGLVGAYAGYKAVIGVFCLLEGLGMSCDVLAEKYAMVPWIGAIVGAGLAVLAGYLTAFSNS